MGQNNAGLQRSSRASRRSQTAPPGYAATRTSPQPGTPRRFAPPPAQRLVSPSTLPTISGPASTRTQASPTSRSSPATSRTSTSRLGPWPSSTADLTASTSTPRPPNSRKRPTSSACPPTPAKPQATPPSQLPGIRSRHSSRTPRSPAPASCTTRPASPSTPDRRPPLPTSGEGPRARSGHRVRGIGPCGKAFTSQPDSPRCTSLLRRRSAQRDGASPLAIPSWRPGTLAPPHLVVGPTEFLVLPARPESERP